MFNLLYYVDGSDPVHEKPVIVPTEKRYLVLDYENPGLKEKDITPKIQEFIDKVEEITDTPVVLVGTGADDKDMIDLRKIK